MKASTTLRICAFCGQQGGPDTRFAAGFGVLIDEDCVRFFAGSMDRVENAKSARSGEGCLQALRRREVSDLTDQELLDNLPQIAGTAAQTNRFMSEWVESIRDRKMSWTVIGNALGISRQAAWERFTRVLGNDHDPVSR